MALRGHVYSLPLSHVYACLFPAYRYTTFAMASKNALSDAYVKFFRWATDRLHGHDGIVCFVSNNGFFNGIAFDGFRKTLLDEFDLIYHFDFKGDARTSGEVRRVEGGNIFDNKIRTGVGITLLVRAKPLGEKKVLYHCVGDYWTSKQKYDYLSSFKGLNAVPWRPLIIDDNSNWLVKKLPPEFQSFLPMGIKEAKISHNAEVPVIFKIYSGGVKTNRDTWSYDFNKEALEEKIRRFIDTYNGEVDRWKRRGTTSLKVDDFVTYDGTKIKWSEGLKLSLQRGNHLNFDQEKICRSWYRPYCKQWFFFDEILTERAYQIPLIFPPPYVDHENIAICVTGIGADCQTFLASDMIVDVKFGISGNSTIQCFPYYIYSEDGSNRHENITDWALAQFQTNYGSEVMKWDIFHYAYAILHHPEYREYYAENLKRDLPYIPLLHSKESFLTCVHMGKQLMDIHLNYEQAKEYPLKWIVNQDVPFSWRVEKMRLTPDRAAVIVNESLTLSGIPQECFDYLLGNRSALDWVIDQYQVSEDKRSGIVSDPNNLDDEEYIVRLIGKVVTVSVETVRLVNELAQAVKMEDWMNETEEKN
jgi:predicted helicase